MNGSDRNGVWGTRSIGRSAYLAASIPLLAVEYGAAFAPALFQPGRSNLLAGAGWLTWFGREGSGVNALLLGMIVVGSSAGLGWLSVRRGRAVGERGSIVALAAVPWLQLLAVAWLSVRRDSAQPQSAGSPAAMRGAFVGLTIALAAEMVLTLAFKSYGIALFIGSPFVVGLVASYFAVRDGERHPLLVAQTALLLASAVLFGFAFEGLFCLFLAYPLAAVAALVGGVVGIVLARHRAPRSGALSSIVLLPFLLATETAEPALAEFDDEASIEVAAPPAAVWSALVHMGRIERRPSAPFGWGLAYPVAGQINGEGVGAVRLGVFSTGVAYERVTRWQRGRALWFDVLSDPPMMRETSPFGPLRTAHLSGYFTTQYARFTLAPRADGGTRLTLATNHALMIAPTTYFLPLARWAVHENKRRVLAHFRDRAEAAN